MNSYLRVTYKGTIVEVPLEHRVTVFMSDSGKGKTRFVATSIESLSDDPDDKILTVTSNRELMFYTDQASPKDFEKVYDRHDDVFYVMDEEFARRFFDIIRYSYDKFIIVSRSRFLLNFTDIRSIYDLVFNNNGFECTRVFTPLPLAGKPDVFVTEAHENNSEHLYIERCMPEISPLVSGKGRNKLCDTIEELLRNKRNIKKVFVAFDMGAGASDYPKFRDIRDEYAVDIYAIPYVCFESVLFYSKLVQGITRSVDSTKVKAFSSEKYYEKLLNIVTLGTPLKSEHPEFSECFTKECTKCCEYSQPSLLLKTLFSEEGLPLLKWYWNTYHPEWVPLTDALVEPLKKSYNPKGFDKSKYDIKE